MGKVARFSWTSSRFRLALRHRIPAQLFDSIFIARVANPASRIELLLKTAAPSFLGLIERIELDADLALEQRRSPIGIDLALCRDDDALPQAAVGLPALRKTLELPHAVGARYPVLGQDHKQDRRVRDRLLDAGLELVGIFNALGIAPYLWPRRADPPQLEGQLLMQECDEPLASGRCGGGASSTRA